MSDFTIRADAVDVEQIMRQIRARIRDKRGVDYTEQQIQELAAVKLERFLDPQGVRSDLLEQFRRVRTPSEPPPPNYAFEDTTLFDSTRGPVRSLRRLLRPVLKLFFNPNPLIQALHIQAKLNTRSAEHEAQREAQRTQWDELYYELVHNLAVEMTRLGIEVKNLKMRLESTSSRLDFDERRARALEGVVQYRPGAGTGMAAAANPPVHPVRAEGAERQVPADQPGDGQRSRRRRRRRGRRGGPSQVGAPSDPTRTETGPSASPANEPHGEPGQSDADRGGPASSEQ